jgi:outer membrane protein assembly factor BamB
MKGRVAGIGTVVLQLGLVAPDARAGDWATPGLDLAHTRLSVERSGAMFGDGTWMASVPGWTIASPVVEDGFIVTASFDGVVTALRADTGEKVWQVALASTVQGTPAVARGRVFVPTVSHLLHALRLSDGATLWQRDVGGMTLSSPAPIDGDIILAPGFPTLNVVRLSGDTGATVWQSAPAMWQFSNTAPAVGGGLAVFGSQQGRYYAFDAATGALRWESVADGTVNLAAPVILDGRVYMAGGDWSNRVHAVDLVTGKAVPGWPIDLPTPAPDIAGTRQGGWRAVSSFAAAGGLLLLQTRLDDSLGARASGPLTWLLREYLVALNPSSGSVVWQRPLARAERADVNDVPKYFVCPTPAAYPTVAGPPLAAVASSIDPVVAVLDVATGSERARYPVAGAALASPVLANGRLYTTSMTGTTQSLGSSVNHAPAAPVAAEYAAPIDLANLTLGWSAAADRDGDAASYEVRIDADGEVLHDWQQQASVGAGVTSARITAALVPGTPYTFSVRARDPHGALSPWSAPRAFTVAGAASPVVVAPPGDRGGPGPGEPGGMTGPTTGTITQVDMAGCSIGGAFRRGGTGALVLAALVLLRTGRRKTSS